MKLRPVKYVTINHTRYLKSALPADGILDMAPRSCLGGLSFKPSRPRRQLTFNFKEIAYTVTGYEIWYRVRLPGMTARDLLADAMFCRTVSDVNRANKFASKLARHPRVTDITFNCLSSSAWQKGRKENRQKALFWKAKLKNETSSERKPVS